MSDTGGLIVYKIIGWKITTMEINGGVLEHPEHPRGYAPAPTLVDEPALASIMTHDQGFGCL